MRLTLQPLSRVLSVVLTGVWLLSPAAHGDSIDLKGSIRLDPDQESVLLSDVAQLTGPYAESLGNEVMRVWDGLGLVTVTVNDVRQMLNDRQVNWGVLSLSGSECAVRPLVLAVNDDEKAPTANESEDTSDRAVFAGDIIREPTLRGEIARLFSLRLFREPAADIRVTFRDDDAERLAWRTDQYQFEITPASTANSGRVPLNVRVFENGRLVESFRLDTRVLIRMEVVIVDRALGRDEILTTDALHGEVRFMAPHPDDPIRRVDQVLGLQAQGRLVAGQILRSDDVAKPIAVRRRSRVIVTAVVGSFAIRMSGRARDDGRVGDVIRVTREPDGYELRARVEPGGELVLVNSP